jgi:hypothetical protein
MRSSSLPKGTGLARGGLSRHRGGPPDGRNSHQIQLVVNISGRRQVAHRGLQGLVAHPYPRNAPAPPASRGLNQFQPLHTALTRSVASYPSPPCLESSPGICLCAATYIRPRRMQSLGIFHFFSFKMFRAELSGSSESVGSLFFTGNAPGVRRGCSLKKSPCRGSLPRDDPCRSYRACTRWSSNRCWATPSWE